MHLIIRSRKPSEIQKLVERENPELASSTAGQSLKAYQAAHGGVGETFHDLEKSWLKSLGSTPIELYMTVLGYVADTIRGNIRTFLSQFTGTAASDYLLLENDDYFLLENGDKLILG